jgi:small redox-active disulfide protein 2
MAIKVLGPGCVNCKTPERGMFDALDELKVEARVERVTDYKEIASFGVMRTPELVIDEKVVWQGSVPSVEKIKEMILARKAGVAVQ